MKNSQIIKEREKVIRRRLLTFFTAVIITFIVIAGSNMVNDGKLVTEADALERSEPVQEVIKEHSEGRNGPDLELFKEYQEEMKFREEMAIKELTIEERISLACEKYGISDEIPLAIAKLETGHFTSNAYLNYNNPGGMSINEVPIKYDTIEDGVEAFISNLAENYFAEGLTTPESISKKYCPCNAETWANIVTQLM